MCSSRSMGGGVAQDAAVQRIGADEALVVNGGPVLGVPGQIAVAVGLRSRQHKVYLAARSHQFDQAVIGDVQFHFVYDIGCFHVDTFLSFSVRFQMKGKTDFYALHYTLFWENTQSLN